LTRINKLDDFIKSPLAVVCHDAGATHLIVHWLEKYNNNIFACMEGPARKIWNSKFPNTRLFSINEAISNANVLLSGTGWASNVEHSSRIEAKKRGITSIAVIDHWTNFQGRFIRNSEEILPDQILVSDDYAEELAVKYFPKILITQLPNLYLKNIVDKVLEIKRNSTHSLIKRILIVTEPFRRKLSKDDKDIEHIAIEYFFNNIDKINIGDNLEVKIRLHPSEDREKYKYIDVVYPEIKISYSDNHELSKDVAWAELVVGCHTFALVVALNCKIPTISILPPEIDFPLPHKGILLLRDL